MPEPPITTIAIVIEVVTPGRLYQVEAKNGLKIPAHISRESKAQGGNPNFEVGDEVTLEFTPYDFSKARIACGDRE
ncbi:MAG: translation initiation factor IF-1 [Verrucomicrobiales bacterium]|jgi:translation initiation factor IF-1